jgi:hypothetical protein
MAKIYAAGFRERHRRTRVSGVTSEEVPMTPTATHAVADVHETDVSSV